MLYYNRRTNAPSSADMLSLSPLCPRSGSYLVAAKNTSPSRHWGSVVFVCVECLIGKQKKPILFKVTEPSSIPYRAPPACTVTVCIRKRCSMLTWDFFKMPCQHACYRCEHVGFQNACGHASNYSQYELSLMINTMQDCVEKRFIPGMATWLQSSAGLA